LAVVAATGGMATPTLLYFLFNQGTETLSGVGKPLGIALFSFLAVKIGLSELPEDVF